jgi:hypothetical protein
MFLTGKAAKKSPLVLLGAVSTAGVLVGGLLAFKKVCRTLGPRAPAAFPLHSSHTVSHHHQGNKDLSQSLMRARVLLQARAGCNQRTS